MIELATLASCLEVQQYLSYNIQETQEISLRTIVLQMAIHQSNVVGSIAFLLRRASFDQRHIHTKKKKETIVRNEFINSPILSVAESLIPESVRRIMEEENNFCNYVVFPAASAQFISANHIKENINTRYDGKKKCLFKQLFFIFILMSLVVLGRKYDIWLMLIL